MRLPVLDDATIPELPNHYKGKVRENYDLPGDQRIIIATDRLSAFDRILTSVPYKGQILTQIARFWFENTADICPNHVISYPDPNVVLGKRLNILPVEIVVRGYLAGTTSTSILTLYKKGQRQMYGITLPDGLKANQKLPTPIITPTSKAFDGGHDEPLSEKQIVEQGLLTQEQWDTVSDYALRLFARGQEVAAERGLILVDTKYEFGTDEGGKIILADEIHTPDSSRYWIAESYQERFETGQRPESFDKDFVRAWVTQRCDPYKDPIPEIPENLVRETSAVYIKAYEMITGESFDAWDVEPALLDRIRNNLKPYFK
ncbi:phosphoribosylaminoimidazolesuccinocarboxamide synthase [Rhizobium sp. L1K21]|uniref:phosphoribosylaminoimidazolesuccinocarboxamide synthase n=1 Tax=Rhizobium sp. L1K21 TaxID=2954933 RepID=UPI0020923921|nr:phosphoribosylaminoimidazolesuccinocarboxamide synthase [Rhizobium sp. L1K21]MCO6186065.1 phosphoribosylaminoimidazolesuccinocarboxamide synthase [Rhizobium sp. L1K21]